MTKLNALRRALPRRSSLHVPPVLVTVGSALLLLSLLATGALATLMLTIALLAELATLTA